MGPGNDASDSLWSIVVAHERRQQEVKLVCGFINRVNFVIFSSVTRPDDDTAGFLDQVTGAQIIQGSEPQIYTLNTADNHYNNDT